MLDTAGRRAVLTLRWVENPEKGVMQGKGVHIDDDDDLSLLWESGQQYIVISVELRQPDIRNSHRLITDEFMAKMRAAADARAKAVDNAANGGTAVPASAYAQSTSAPRDPGQAATSQTPQTPNPSQERDWDPDHPAKAHRALEGLRARIVEMQQHEHVQQLEQQRYEPGGNRLNSGNSNVGSAGAWGEGQATSTAYSQPQDPHSVDYFNVRAPSVGGGAREYTFPLEWRHGTADKTELVMGMFGKPEWAGQRAWGYKQTEMPDTKGSELSVTYAPRLSSSRMALEGETFCSFTIFFNTRPLAQLALSNLPRKLPSLTPTVFRSSFILPLSTRGIVTEWACVCPPPDLVPADPRGGGEMRLVYVVKDSRDGVGELCGREVGGWLSRAVAEGVWASEMVKRTFPQLVARNRAPIGLDI
ncbi:hypothetical protein HDU93_005004 [Gonapodya sp. JEL0774]|nr:hypothetical protein HDU93_005004 [Gonapodya sp. JEL0774]